MSETRKYCCYGLFSLEKGSVIIAIFNLIIAISALIGLICIVMDSYTIYGFPFYHYYIRYQSEINVVIFVEAGLSVLFNSMLIYGISKERSAYLLPGLISYILNIVVVSELQLNIQQTEL